jgi:hypothetical protein
MTRLSQCVSKAARMAKQGITLQQLSDPNRDSEVRPRVLDESIDTNDLQAPLLIDSQSQANSTSGDENLQLQTPNIPGFDWYLRKN